MDISYKKLWKLLIYRDMKNKDLEKQKNRKDDEECIRFTEI